MWLRVTVRLLCAQAPTHHRTSATLSLRSSSSGVRCHARRDVGIAAAKRSWCATHDQGRSVAELGRRSRARKRRQGRKGAKQIEWAIPYLSEKTTINKLFAHMAAMAMNPASRMEHDAGAPRHLLLHTEKRTRFTGHPRFSWHQQNKQHKTMYTCKEAPPGITMAVPRQPVAPDLVPKNITSIQPGQPNPPHTTNADHNTRNASTHATLRP